MCKLKVFWSLEEGDRDIYIFSVNDYRSFYEERFVF